MTSGVGALIRKVFPPALLMLDLDNDGDLDLVVNNSNDFAGIYKNNAETLVKNNYLRVQLAGSACQPQGHRQLK